MPLAPGSPGPQHTHQEEGGADELPAQSPVEAGLEPHHLLDVVAEPVHTWAHRAGWSYRPPKSPGPLPAALP